MKMDREFIAFVDESGDEGFVFKGPGKGSSSWFVLSAVVLRGDKLPDLINAMRSVRDRLQLKKGHPLHFARIKNHDKRLCLIGEIAALPIRTITIAIHKLSIKNQAVFTSKDRLYCYACRYLLERVSWLCRDSHTAGDGRAQVIFSNKSALSYDGLKAYFDKLKSGADYFGAKIEWSVISTEDMSARAHGDLLGLQVADAVASGLWTGLEKSQYGHIEDRFARMLRTVAYEYAGKAMSYGLKVWPVAIEELIAGDSELAWIRDVYQ